MIPLRDQEFLRQRFQRELTSRLRIDLFTQKPSSIFIAGRQECALCHEAQTLMEELASLSERINLTVHELSDSAKQARELGVDKVPGIVIRGQTNRPVRFFGLPYGGQFMGFVETLLDAAKGQVQLDAETVKVLRRLKNDVKLHVMVTPACPHSPLVARNALKFGLQSVRVKVDIIELGEFLPLAQRHAIRAVPAVVFDEKLVLQGALDEHTLATLVLQAAEGKPYTGQARVGPGTVFTPPSTQQSQQQQPQRVTSSGLILPP